MRNSALRVCLAVSVLLFWPAISQLRAQTEGTPPQKVIDVWEDLIEVKHSRRTLTRQEQPVPAELTSSGMQPSNDLSTMLMGLTNEQRDGVAVILIDILSRWHEENEDIGSKWFSAILLLHRLNSETPDGLPGLSHDVFNRASQAIVSIAASQNATRQTRYWAFFILQLTQFNPNAFRVETLVNMAHEAPPPPTFADRAEGRFVAPIAAISWLGGYASKESTDALFAMWNETEMRILYTDSLLGALSQKSDPQAFDFINKFIADIDLREEPKPVVYFIINGRATLAWKIHTMAEPTRDQSQQLDEIRGWYTGILRRADEIYPGILEGVTNSFAAITRSDDSESLTLLDSIMPKLSKDAQDRVSQTLKRANRHGSDTQPSDR